MYSYFQAGYTNSKAVVVNIEAFRHLIMSQQGKRKTKILLYFYI